MLTYKLVLLCNTKLVGLYLRGFIYISDAQSQSLGHKSQARVLGSFWVFTNKEPMRKYRSTNGDTKRLWRIIDIPGSKGTFRMKGKYAGSTQGNKVRVLCGGINIRREKTVIQMYLERTKENGKETKKEKWREDSGF